MRGVTKIKNRTVQEENHEINTENANNGSAQVLSLKGPIRHLTHTKNKANPSSVYKNRNKIENLKIFFPQRRGKLKFLFFFFFLTRIRNQKSIGFFIVTLDGGKTAANLSISEVRPGPTKSINCQHRKKDNFKIRKVSKK